MTSDQKEILEVINQSFVGQEARRSLKEQLEKEGLSDEFFATMSKLFTDELMKRSVVYEKAVDDFDARYKTINKRYAEGKSQLDTNLEARLSEVDPIDLSGREKIFDHYYKEIEGAQKNYEKELKNLFLDLSRSAMQTTL